MQMLEHHLPHHHDDSNYYYTKSFFPSVPDLLPGSPLTRSPSPQPPSRRARSPSIAPIDDGFRPQLSMLLNREASFRVTKINTSSTWAQLREEVVAWFIDVCAELSLSQPVVAIAANIFDRFACISQPSRELIPPLAAACLLIAAKVAEDEQSSTSIIDNLARRVGLRPRHLADGEAAVLSTLDWRVNVVTPHEVARELLDALGGASRLPVRALHELETIALAATLEHALINVPPTTIATAAIVAALESVPRNDMDECYQLATLRVNTFVLARDSGFDMNQVDNVLPVLRASVRRIVDSEVLEEDE